MKEIWKDIPGYKERYQVSNNGNVRSINRRLLAKDNVFYKRKGYNLKPCPSGKGYLAVQLSKDNNIKRFYMHQLVALAFLDKDYMKKGLQVNHKNGNKKDNRAENLETVTLKSNMMHASAAGLLKPKRGEESGKAKLSESDVLFIRDVFSKCALRKFEICLIFNMSMSGVRAIISGINWRHLL